MKWLVHPKDTGLEGGLARTNEDTSGPGKGDFAEPEGIIICISPCGCLSGQICLSEDPCPRQCLASKSTPDELAELSPTFEALVTSDS